MKLILIVILICLVIALPIYGYIANIVKLCHCDFETPFKAEAIRAVGVFVFPVGIITGFCTIADGKPDPNSF